MVKEGFVMAKYMVSMMTVVFLLIGCQTNDNQNKDAADNEVLEGEMNVKNDFYKEYTQSEEKGIAPDGTKEELFSSSEQREIIQHISQMEHVDSVYVNHGQDKVNVMVSVREGPYDDIKKTIRRYIKDNFPQRKVDIFIIQSTG